MCDLSDLLLRGAGLHPPGCVDVNSEGAPVDQRDAQVDEREEVLREEAGSVDGRGELLGGLHDPGRVSLDLRRVEHEAERIELFVEVLLEGRLVAWYYDLAHTRQRGLV